MCALAVPLKLVQQWDTSRNVHVHNNIPIYICIFSIVYRLTLALVQSFDVGGSVQNVPKYTLTLYIDNGS